MEKVTVIIPAYNAQRCIEKCLKSVVEQTYPDLEVIVINDGSTDKTGEICLRWQEKSSKLCVLEVENGGVSRARNRGIEKASGSYLMFVDADDYLEKNAVENLMKYRREAEWVIGNYWITDMLRGKSGIHEQYFVGERHRGDKEELPKLCEFRNFNCVWAKLYKLDVVRRYNLRFDEQYSYGEDLLFNCAYFSHVKHFMILNIPVYHYCYYYGEGLGTQYRQDEWRIQEKLCRTLQIMVREVYGLSRESQCDMNHFYYAQSIATLQRIAAEKNIGKKDKRKKISEVTHSDFFIAVLNQEYEKKRIKILDFQLLKNHKGLLYDSIHRGYVCLKKLIGRAKI